MADDARPEIIEFQTKGSKKSDVWKNFGFLAENGQPNKTKVVCKVCHLIMPYSGNTTNMRAHIDRKHWSLSSSVS